MPIEKFAIPLSNLTTAHSVQSEAKEVERQLKRENKKISELESRVTLFRRMVKHNIPTRDVSSFVVKQLNLTSTTRAPCKKTIKAAMKAKLLDVKVATNLRKKERESLMKDLSYKLKNDRQKYNEIIENLKGDTVDYRRYLNSKNNLKFKRQQKACLLYTSPSPRDS